MRLYGKKIGSYCELNEYKKGTKKIVITAETLVTVGDGVVLFNRANKVACVMEVTKVEKAGDGHQRYLFVKVLNPEDQDIPVEYFGFLGFVGLHFLGYSVFCNRLKINQ